MRGAANRIARQNAHLAYGTGYWHQRCYSTLRLARRAMRWHWRRRAARRIARASCRRGSIFKISWRMHNMRAVTRRRSRGIAVKYDGAAAARKCRRKSTSGKRATYKSMLPYEARYIVSKRKHPLSAAVAAISVWRQRHQAKRSIIVNVSLMPYRAAAASNGA